jgi:hypothetical protein
MVHGEYASNLKPFFYPKKYKKKKEQKRGGKERERENGASYTVLVAETQ